MQPLLYALLLLPLLSFRLFRPEAERALVLRQLRQLQNNVFFPSFRKKLDQQISLKSFKQDMDRRILAYYGQVQVGGQLVNLLFDSGSTSLMLMGARCKSLSCQGHHLFQAQSAKVLESQHALAYICGHSSGSLVQTRVQLGEALSLQAQAVHVGETVAIPAFVASRWDGIMGLGYLSPSADLNKRSVVDNIMALDLLPKDRQYFIYSLDESAGRLSFGEMPPNHGPITWVPVDSSQVSEEVSWILSLKDIQLRHPHRLREKESPSVCPHGCRLLIDTGTYLNYLPVNMFRGLLGSFDFRGDLCRDMSALPDLVFLFQQGQSMTLKPSQYLETYSEAGETLCTNSFTPDEVETDLVTLGQMFLKTFQTVFDFSQKRIGFMAQPGQ